MFKKLFCIFFLAPFCLSAQSFLSAEEAVQIGLKNNFDVLIAHNQAEANSLMNTFGEAGMLPTLALNATAGANQNNIQQKYSNGNEINQNGVTGSNISPSIVLTWTLFDGTKMFITKNKLKEIERLGLVQYKEQMLNTTLRILLSYYDIVRQQMQLKATLEIIAYNEERVKITEGRLNTGLAPKTDYLQAQIDLNIQKENKINFEFQLVDAKRKLNNLLARDASFDYKVEDSITLQPLANRSILEEKMERTNPTLLSFQSQVAISKLSYLESKTSFLPKLVMTSGYNFNKTQNSAGFSLYNQSYGWQSNFALSMPLYQAGKLKHIVQLAKLNIQTLQEQLSQATLAASLSLQSALALYDVRINAYNLEKENEHFARENMNLSLKRLQLGLGTALDVAQAQATFSGSVFRMASFMYDLKTAELNARKQAADF